MEYDEVEQAVARKSVLIYLPVSIGAALLFLLAASLTGDHPLVARVGGTIWVGILSLIVSMPLITARVKKQSRGTLSHWTLAKRRKNKGLHLVDEAGQGTNAPYRCWRSGSAPAGDRIACGRGVGRLRHGGQEPLQYGLARALFEDHL